MIMGGKKKGFLDFFDVTLYSMVQKKKGETQVTALVIPIKKLDEVKQRLKGVLPVEERVSVCLFLLRRLLSEAHRSGAFSRIYLVSPQEDIMKYLEDFPQVIHICSQADRGLNEAAREAARRLCGDGVDRMVFLHGDLPYATGEDLRGLCLEAEKTQVVLIPDSRKKGTTGMVLTPPDCMDTCFGEDSFSKHQRRCREMGLSYRVFYNEGLGRDLDLPEDWDRFRKEYSAFSDK